MRRPVGLLIQQVSQQNETTGLIPDMVDSVKKKIEVSANFFKRSLSWFNSKAPKGTEPVLRRLITLIFADWVPHDLASSRSCLGLSSGVQLN